jgi:hypothetical protein
MYAWTNHKAITQAVAHKPLIMGTTGKSKC